jgi:G3E family GTPase
MTRISLDDLGLERVVPVTVVTGFLGSGKTTLLSRLLAHSDIKNTAVIVNELGEVGLDHLLVQSPVDETILLENGCICCTMRGDLSATLQEMVARCVSGELPRLDRVVVETTGSADPVPLLQTLVEDVDVTNFYRFDGLVTVVDAFNGSQQLDVHFQSIKQAALADLVLFSKTDLVDGQVLDNLGSRIQRLNPGVKTGRVLNGEIDPQVILGIASPGRDSLNDGVDAWLSEAAHEAVTRVNLVAHQCDVESENDDHRHHNHNHNHDDAVNTFSVTRAGEIHPAALNLWLDLISVFQGPALLRAKGILNINGYPVLINVVQHVCHPPRELEVWPDDDRSTRIVFITHNLDQQSLKSTLSALDYMPSDSAPQELFTQDDYRQFTNILENIKGVSTLEA